MGNTTIWQRQALLDSGEHTPELKFFYDGFMSQVLALRYGSCFIPEPLGEFRQVAGQLCEEALDVGTALSVFRLASELMRTKYSDLFPEDYIVKFERRTAANTIEASIKRSSKEQLECLRSTLSRSRLTDQLMLAGVWLVMHLQFCVTKLYLATVRHGCWGAVVRLLKLTILRPFFRSPRYNDK
jgi:hypothetical protein